MNARKIGCLVVGLAVVAPALAALVEVKNAGFEKPDAAGRVVGWSAARNWHAEHGAGVNGAGGMVYECTNATDALSCERPGQEIKVEAGKRYYFSASARAEGLKTERPSTVQGVTLYLEGYDAKGKWLFGKAAEPCANGTTRDWIKVEGVTREVPEGVVRAYIQAYAPGRCIGRGVLDNVLVREFELPPVEGVFADAYRRELFEGRVVFHAVLNTDRNIPLAEYSAEFAYAGRNGRPVRKPGRIVSPTEASFELDVADLAFGRHDVSCTLKLKGKALGTGSSDFTRVKKPTSRRVWIDKYHRTIVDGKPFFPLGMFFGRATRKEVDTYSQGPFNCLMPYRSPNKEELDHCQEKGLKVLYDLRGGMNDKDDGKAWVTKRVEAFRDHPALLAWYTNDESPVSDVPKLAARQRWVEDLDPDHPTWCAQDVYPEIPHFLTTYDVLGMDPYPIPKKPIELVISAMRQGAAGTFGTRAVWQIPQAFGWGWLKRRETKGQRAPTREEMANMSWQSIAGGANGLIYYAFQHLAEPHDDPNDAFEPAWARTRSMAAEVAKYEQMMLSVEPAPQPTDVPAELAVRTWRFEGSVYAILVNCTAKPQKTSIRFTERLGKIVSHDFGPRPTLEGDRLTVDFGPIEYVMVRLIP